MARPIDAVISSARDFLGERLTTNAALREQHSHGEDTQPPVLPDAVAFIETTEEAARISLCATRMAFPSSRSAPARRWRAMSRRCAAASRSTSRA